MKDLVEVIAKALVDHPEDYWALRYYIPEKVKYSFDERKITIPYNRLEVDILDKGNEK